MTPSTVSSYIVVLTLCTKLFEQCNGFVVFNRNPVYVSPLSLIPCSAYNMLVNCNLAFDSTVVGKSVGNTPRVPAQLYNNRSLKPLTNRRLSNSRPQSILNGLSTIGQKSIKLNLMLNKSVENSNTRPLLGKLFSRTTRKYYEATSKDFSTHVNEVEVTTPGNFNYTSQYDQSHQNTDRDDFEINTTTENYNVPNIDPDESSKNVTSFEMFVTKLTELDRKFYKITFNKLLTISPADRRENGISFVQSGFLLYLTLLGVSLDLDQETRAEIDQCLDFTGSNDDRIQTIKQAQNWLPKMGDELKFRWASRLAINPPTTASETLEDTAKAIGLKIYHFEGSESTEKMMNTLNHLIELDSGGAMQDTFDEDELSQDVRGVLIAMAYLRGRWRSAPTLLNGTHQFHDANTAPPRAARMIRINDVMRYAYLNEWDAEAVEISYATAGLTLLMVIPTGESLRAVAEKLSTVNMGYVTSKMYSVRAAVTIPLYTLRMTLLLPGKLNDMGINRLFEVSNNTQHPQRLTLSHAIQRLMFWSEAGRNAFKDDGIEWDEAAELELVVNRPYVFFVRWHNVTLMNGNFVL